MPDKPLWLDRLSEAIRQLEISSEPWIDRPALESLLGVGRRRAQQILAPLTQRRVGTSVVAARTDVLTHLQTIAAGEAASYEIRRRKRLWMHLAEARRQWQEQPPVWVEVPDAEVRRVELHDFAGLPAGVTLAPGSITVQFQTPEEALQKLMALALAISSHREAFDERVRLPDAEHGGAGRAGGTDGPTSHGGRGTGRVSEAGTRRLVRSEASGSGFEGAKKIV